MSGRVALLAGAAFAAGCAAATPPGPAGSGSREAAVPGDAVSGTLRPVGPPVEAPVRVAAGPHCIVDLRQRYELTGDLAGTAEIDYRILVEGPCGSPPGTHAEEWIAHGTFDGSLRGERASARFTYTASARAGGRVEGIILLADHLDGSLSVVGNFADGFLSYSGRAGASR